MSTSNLPKVAVETYSDPANNHLDHPLPQAHRHTPHNSFCLAGVLTYFIILYHCLYQLYFLMDKHERNPLFHMVRESHNPVSSL